MPANFIELRRNWSLDVSNVKNTMVKIIQIFNAMLVQINVLNAILLMIKPIAKFVKMTGSLDWIPIAMKWIENKKQ